MASCDVTSSAHNKSVLPAIGEDGDDRKYRNPEVYARYVFNSRGQKPHETFEEYFGVVQILSKTCNFGDMLDDLLRDRVLVGIRDEQTKKRLLQEEDLSLARCRQICLELENQTLKGSLSVEQVWETSGGSMNSSAIASVARENDLPLAHFQGNVEQTTHLPPTPDRSTPPKKRGLRLRHGEAPRRPVVQQKRIQPLRKSSRGTTRSQRQEQQCYSSDAETGLEEDSADGMEEPETPDLSSSPVSSDVDTEVESPKQTVGAGSKRKQTLTKGGGAKSKSVECPDCGEVFPNRTKLSRHRDSFHRAREKVKCDICGKLVTKYYLPLHKNIHTLDKPFPCGECGKLCPTKNHLEYHKNTTGHMRDGVVKVKSSSNCFCEICGKKFSNKTNLRKHVEVHTGEKKCECPICGKELIHTDYLQRHMVTHSEDRPYQCDLCGKKFKKKLILREHQSRHSMDKSSACEYCGKVFAIKGDLLKHVQLHTGQKKFACPHCPKRFNVGTQLRYHTMSVHTKHKPYVCEKCGKGFIKLCLLKVHSSTHNTTREYGCKQCERTFKTSRSLKEHERIHSGERLFVCHLCGKEFYRSGHLKQHLKTHQKPGTAAGVRTVVAEPPAVPQRPNTWLPPQPHPDEALAKKFLPPLEPPPLPPQIPHWFHQGDNQAMPE